MIRRMSSSNESSSGRSKSQLSKIQVSAPFFWDFGVYERVFGKSNDNGTSVEASNNQSNSTETPRKPALQSQEEAETSSGSQSKRVAWASTFREEDLITYMVQFGDTFESIALKHDMTAVELRRANPGVPFFSRAVPGEQLRVKKIAEEPPAATEDASNSKTDNLARNGSSDPAPASDQQTSQGVEHEALLCLGASQRTPGRLIVGITSGFLLFEPFETANSTPQGSTVRMVFALDRRDILGCAAVSRINARLRGEDQDASMLLQVVWKNADLGFPEEQQIFFEVPSTHISALVDAIYASDPLRKASPRSAAKTLTSGVPALRVLEENQTALIVEEFMTSTRHGSVSILEDVTLDVVMIPHDSTLVSKENITTIATMLPERLHNSRWQLLYDFTNHGVSLDALFTAAKSHRETVLLIRDIDNKEVIGAFTVEPWDYSQHTGFFGSGETFVFRVEDNDLRDIQKFPWSGANEFFQTCSLKHLAVGGGGNFAICLDGDLLHCTSGPCRTFSGLEDKPLASKPSFRIDGIELWGFETFAKGRSPTLSFEDWTKSPVLNNGKSSPREPSSESLGASTDGSKKEDAASKQPVQKIKQPPLKSVAEGDTDEYVKL